MMIISTQCTGIDKIDLTSMTLNNDNIPSLLQSLAKLPNVDTHMFNNFNSFSSKITFLKIKDNDIFNVAELKYNPTQNTVKFALSFSATNFYNGSNVQNMSVVDIRNYCGLLETYLEDAYNIQVDLNSCKITKIEINTNIRLDHTYTEYIPSLDNLINKVLTYHKTFINHSPLIDTALEREESPTTKAIGNTQLAIIHYDKMKEANAKKKIPPIDDEETELMRIELKLLDARKIQKLFGTNYLYSPMIDDKLLSKTFKEQYKKNIIDRYQKAETKRYKELKSFVMAHAVEKKNNWHYHLLEELRNQNERRLTQKNGFPLVQSITEILQIITENTKGNITRTVTAFERKQTFDDVLYHSYIHPEYIDEIFGKVMSSK